MRAGKIIVVAAALGAVSVVAMGAVSIVHRGSGEETAVAQASPDRDGQSTSALVAPITPSDGEFTEPSALRAYGWGPFRITDW